MNRREFLSGGAMLAAAAVTGRVSAMNPDEQRAWDAYTAAPTLRSDKSILDSAPFLQVPAPDSMGVVFAVNELANGFADVADNPEMKNAMRFMAEGLPQAGFDDRVIQVRMMGLRPATKYWYRVGACGFTYPVGYWMKQKEVVWSQVFTFTTAGEGAESRFAVINDTHAHWESFRMVTDKLAELNPPVVVWNGDIPTSMTNSREDFVRLILKPQSGAGFASSLPVLLNRGNHDFRGTASVHLENVMMTRLPTERSMRDWTLNRNFAYRQGEIALIGLDTGEDKPDRHPAFGGTARFEPYRTAQTAWLRDQFKRPEIALAPFVVAFVHIPIFDVRPEANPGTILEDWADWQQQCAEEWGPILTENRVQVVVAGHRHCYRFDPAAKDRSWAQIVGGGPYSEKGGDPARFPTVIEGCVEGDKLVMRVHDVLNSRIAGSFAFDSRKI